MDLIPDRGRARLQPLEYVSEETMSGWIEVLYIRGRAVLENWRVVVGPSGTAYTYCDAREEV